MRGLFLVMLAFLLLAAPCTAFELDEAADALARKFFAGAASADREIRLGAVDALYSAATLEKVGSERLEAQLERIGTTFGAVEFHQVEVSSSDLGDGLRHIAHIFARKVTGEWLDFQFFLDPDPPVRFKELAFVANVTEPVVLPNGDIGDSATLTWLDGYVTKMEEKEGLSGAILIAVGDVVVFERYFGAADAKGSMKIDADTRFSLGSGNKMMTALLAARLVEQGELSFDTKLRALVPAFPQSASADAVTLHHLLSRSSGIGEYWTKEFALTRPNLLTNADFLPWITKRGFDFDPGTAYSYSNSNFILAGLAVEKVSSVGYEKALEAQIFEPLGMSGSSLGIGGAGVFAEPLVRAGDGWEHSGLRGRGSSAGGAWSTPRDMLRFSRGLQAGMIVSKPMLKRMTTSKTSGLKGAEPYGYGFILHQYGNVRAFGHGGTAEARRASLEHGHREHDMRFPSTATRTIRKSNLSWSAA
jgi:CubicO group peptidase (beta-lactamase class C family)